MNILRLLIILKFVIIFSLESYSQVNDEKKKDTLLIVDFFEDYKKKGYDSIGNKQGFWVEDIRDDEYCLFYEDYIVSYNAKAAGFYINDKKEGFWKIYTYTGNKDKLYAHIYYKNDTMKYQFTYDNNKISQYTEIGYKDRIYNTSSSGIIYVISRIVFNNLGEIKLIESYAPDGIYEKEKFLKYPSKCKFQPYPPPSTTFRPHKHNTTY